MTVDSDSDQLLVEFCERLAFMLDDLWMCVNGPALDTAQSVGAPKVIELSEELASLARSSSHPLVRETLPWLVLFPQLLLGTFGGYELLKLMAEYGWKRLYDSCYHPLIRLQGLMMAEMASWPRDSPLTPRAQQVHEIIIDSNEKGKPITGPEIVAELDRRKSDDISPISLNNLTGRIIPELKLRRGLWNSRRIGYYYPEHYKPREGDNPTEA